MTIVCHAVLRGGTVEGFEGTLPEFSAEVLLSTVAFYERAGFQAPWISYLAFRGQVPVGICSFKTPPQDQRVEIAYFTFPDFERQGLATEMARALVAIARRHLPTITVTAQTLPEEGASPRVLKKVGFRFVGVVDHPEDGPVWEWSLMPQGASLA